MYILKRINTKLAELSLKIQAKFGGTARLLAPLDRLKRPGPRLILFGCLGNICRSPYAAVKFEKLLLEKQIDSIEVRSFGLDTTPGLPADETASRVAAKRGILSNGHLTSRFDPDLAAKADLILVMEPRHQSMIKRSAPQAADKTLLLGLLNLDQGGPVIIEDPFMKDDTVFEKCFDQIDSALKALIDRL